MKWRFLDPKSGFRIFSAVAMGRGSPRSTDGSRDGSRPRGESKQWYCLLSARCLRRRELRRGGIAPVTPRFKSTHAEDNAITNVVDGGPAGLTLPIAAGRDGHAVLVVAAA